MPISDDYDDAGNEFGRLRWAQIDADEAADGRSTSSAPRSASESRWPARGGAGRHHAPTRPRTMRIAPSVAAAIAAALRPRRPTQARKDAIALRVRWGANV